MELEKEITKGKIDILDSTETGKENISRARFLRFFLPSLLGALIFMTPVVIDGRVVIPIVHLIEIINSMIKPYMLEVSVLVAVVPSLLTAVVSFNRRLKAIDNRFVQLLNPGLKWTMVRLLGAVTMLLVYYQIGRVRA